MVFYVDAGDRVMPRACVNVSYMYRYLSSPKKPGTIAPDAPRAWMDLLQVQRTTSVLLALDDPLKSAK